MVSRIMVSLRKAVDLQQGGWSLDLPSLEFVRPRLVGTNRTENEDGLYS